MGRRLGLRRGSSRSFPRRYKGFRIVLVGEKHQSLGGGVYRGMNAFAAREKRIPFPYGDSTLVVWREDPDVLGVAQHEVDEVNGYKLGLKYPVSHPIATALEPFHQVAWRLTGFEP